MRGRGFHLFGAVLAAWLVAPAAYAQGGGASTTGSINGKVADSSGGVLPGVTVTASGPSLMGVQTSVTDASGNYRFPALPPGSYTVTFELAGFNTLKRENIQIAMGFTATVNVELAVASLQETVTVTGDSPVIDTSSTRIQQNFKLEALQEIPNARDLWSLLAVTPAVTMGRIDVGGNRAGTQTGYTAYGFSGQNRVLVEGINTTEGTSGAGFYVDYASFEEVFLGTIGQGAEMPTPGVQSQMLGKSGGNKFQGEIYQDYERNSWQADNIVGKIPSQFFYDAVNNPTGAVRDHSNELQKYRDFNVSVGGPISKDRLWWYFSYRNQKNSVGQPNFIGPISGTLFDTLLWNPSGKATYQVNKNNKLIGYYQWGQKEQPNRLPSSTNSYTDLGTTLFQKSGSWIYKGEWNGTVSNNVYVEGRYGVFGYYFPLITNTDAQLHEIVNAQLAQYFNGDQKEQTDRQRRQATGSMTYFKDAFLGGSHNFKVGGELLLESAWVGYQQVYGGNVRENIGTNGLPSTVNLGAPTATHVGSLGDGPNGNLLSLSKLSTIDWFLTDQYTLGRATLNLGIRFDHYDAWTPDQKQLAYSFGPLVIPDATFPEAHYVKWNKIVPRLGISYDLMGDGKTVLKANWGLYGFNPGVGLAQQANPNQDLKNVTYTWTDTKVCPTCVPGDRIYEPGEEGNLTASALSNAITVDPNIKQPMSTQATAYVERQITEGVGARVGFVYYSVSDQFNTFQPLRPASAYNAPFTFTDVGPDGKAGTADDKALTLYGIPSSLISGCSASVTTVTPTCAFPTNSVVMTVPNNGKYKTLEFSLNKRQSHNYSLGAGFGYTWQHDFPATFAATPNGPFDYDYSSASFKANGTYNAPYGILLSGVYRYQLGANYARTVAPGGSQANCQLPGGTVGACTFSAQRGTSTTVYANQTADAMKEFRQDNISVMDLRVEKTVNLGGSVKVRLFGDIYNITNFYAAETITQSTGSAFQTPTAILGPRTGRVGFRFIW